MSSRFKRIRLFGDFFFCNSIVLPNIFYEFRKCFLLGSEQKKVFLFGKTLCEHDTRSSQIPQSVLLQETFGLLWWYDGLRNNGAYANVWKRVGNIMKQSEQTKRIMSGDVTEDPSKGIMKITKNRSARGRYRNLSFLTSWSATHIYWWCLSRNRVCVNAKKTTNDSKQRWSWQGILICITGFG